MSRNSSGIFTSVFAENGDKSAPTFTFTDGWDSDYAPGGGKYPEREVFNYLYNQLYALGVDVNENGAALPWDTTITYNQGAFVIGSDFNVYLGLTASNQGNDPTSTSGFWIRLPNDADFSDNASASTAGATLVGIYVTDPGTNTNLTNNMTLQNFLNNGWLKAFGRVEDLGGGYEINTSYPYKNVASVSEDSTGEFTVTLTNTTAYNFLPLAVPNFKNQTYIGTCQINTVTTTSFGVTTTRGDNSNNESWPFSFVCI